MPFIVVVSKSWGSQGYHEFEGLGFKIMPNFKYQNNGYCIALST
jgi:hypothetical protein